MPDIYEDRSEAPEVEDEMLPTCVDCGGEFETVYACQSGDHYKVKAPCWRGMSWQEWCHDCLKKTDHHNPKDCEVCDA